MQIHELNNYIGTLSEDAFVAVDNGNDTGKISAPDFLKPATDAITAANQRIDNIISSPAPTEAEIIDARQGYFGQDYTSLGASIRGQIGDLDTKFTDFENDIATHYVSKNRYDGTYTPGYFVSQADGKLYASSTYGATDFIDVSEADSIVISCHDNVSVRFALYTGADETKFVSGDLRTNIPVDAELARFYTVIDVSSAKYIRFSVTLSVFAAQSVTKLMLEYGDTPTAFAAYFKDYYILDVGDYSQLESSVFGGDMNPSAGAMSDGTKLVVESNSVRKSNQIVFFGKFSSFNRLYVGHGETGTQTEFIVIDNTSVYFATNGNIPSSGVSHGLTIETYLGVIIDINDDCTYTITLYTLSGTYTRTIPSTSPWIGCNGEIFAKSVGSVFTEASLTFNADYQKNKWIFGDSYITNYSPERWTYYLQSEGFDNSFMNGYPGEAAAAGYNDFSAALNHGTPKYALWALGMNNPDSGSINSAWKTATDAFISDCVAKGITPILATIPNTPTQNHVYKNDYVKSLSYRYIDFAEAVGAASAGASWYAGCLSSDNVHPTANGARLLFLQALRDFPELMQK